MGESGGEKKFLNLKNEFDAYTGIPVEIKSFTTDDPTANIPVKLPDYQLVAAVALMEWKRDPETGTYSPAADYAEGVDRSLVLKVPEGVTQDSVKTSLVFLANGKTLFSAEAPETIMDRIYNSVGTQREALRKLERVHDAPSAVMRKAEQLMSAPVTVKTPEMEITFRDARMLARSTIYDLEWEPKDNGDYKPANKFTQDTLDRFGFRPDGNLDSYPQSLIVLPDETALLSTAPGEAVLYTISRALEDRESSIAVLSRSIAQNEAVPIPQLQPQPDKSRPETSLDVM